MLRPRTDSEGNGISLQEISARLSEVVDRSSSSVMGVRVLGYPRSRRPWLRASGILVHPDYVVTNAHVVSEGGHAQIDFADGSSTLAPVAGRDPLTDLAVLRLPRPAPSGRVLEWGRSENLREGQLVLALTNPLALERTVSLGVISSLHRRFVDRGRTRLDGVLQTDAAVAPGSSGGALLTTDARLVGVILANNVRYSGLAFAIPSITAEWVVEQLIAHGRARRSLLGLHIRTVPLPRSLEATNSGRAPRRCVRVEKVVPGLPGERAGVQAGDFLIAADGRPLEAVCFVQRYLGIEAVGRKVSLDVLRGEERLRVGLVPAADPQWMRRR